MVSWEKLSYKQSYDECDNKYSGSTQAGVNSVLMGEGILRTCRGDYA